MLQIKATFVIPSVMFTTSSSQLPDMVFFFPQFDIGHSVCKKVSLSAEFCLSQLCKTKMILSQGKLFQSTTQSNLPTLKRLIQLPTCIF
jgi:hypothetical protein